jgi:hypothetical protein
MIAELPPIKETDPDILLKFIFSERFSSMTRIELRRWVANGNLFHSTKLSHSIEKVTCLCRKEHIKRYKFTYMFTKSLSIRYEFLI